MKILKLRPADTHPIGRRLAQPNFTHPAGLSRTFALHKMHSEASSITDVQQAVSYSLSAGDCLGISMWVLSLHGPLTRTGQPWESIKLHQVQP